MSGKISKRGRKLSKLPVEEIIKKLTLPALQQEYMNMYRDYNDLLSASDNLYGGATKMRRTFWRVLIPVIVIGLTGWVLYLRYGVWK